MAWLVAYDPNNPSKSRVEVYREKQEKYTAAFERKSTKFHEALDKVDKTLSPEDQRAEYARWVNANYKTYNNLIQAAYMDWVTMGKKEEVEYYFSIVDNDSAMARVEASKVLSLTLRYPANRTRLSLYRNVCADRSSPMTRDLRNTKWSS